MKVRTSHHRAGMTAIDQAYRLAEAGQVRRAVALLKHEGDRGDPAALVELAAWYLGARYVERDLQLARQCFGSASKLGHQRASEIYTNLLANGTGGTRRWREALARLELAGRDDLVATEQRALLGAMDIDGDGEPRTKPTGQQLSDAPSVMLFKNFMTSTECRHLVERAKPGLSPSVVVHPATGQMVPHPVRTSDNAFFPWIDEDPVIHVLNRRIAAATATEASWGEPLQVLRYGPGQEYRPHHDAIAGADNQRILTFLVYLNDGYEGGETEFIRTGLKVAGCKGDGLMFRNADDAGRPDPNAVHAGRPVTAGEKMLATRWIHQRPFGPR
ncbi:MAG: hypothetical protein AVDCRST_MAG31-1423 [uncultured Sphingomonas sp.]|uniref:Fe2OG dioxygenase domain-containing protein n=2 Tax=uncultured Sphingomonas sp. TaxID=158754 RepID=A0A6J4TAD8_9SPHN|nr:MAG: hypothetical protein AVDCRST_MAG31-1423 [uncultured Sphingomonas sp.]